MTGVHSRFALALLALLALVATACAGPATRSATHPPTAAAGRAPSTAPPTAAAPGTLRVVGLGDSVMAGTNCGCSGLAQEYGAALATRTGAHVRVTNLGVGGMVTGDLLEDLAGDATTRSAISSADLVLVTIGANDLLPELDTWESTGCDRSCFRGPAARMGQSLGHILAAIRGLRPGRSGGVLVTDYWNVFTDGDAARSTGGQAQVDWATDVTAVANQEICTAARAAGDTCVDLVAPFKPHGADPTPLLADDGDHPNAAGVRVIVHALLAATPADPGAAAPPVSP